MFGQTNLPAGVVTTTDTSAVTGEFTAITILADAIFSTFTERNATGAMTSITIPAGVTIFGSITAYTLTSGKVRAYK